MATSVTQSLFGITPQSIQNERDAALQQQALQFAKLDPFQSARMGLFQGAAQLGSGIVGALGDPEIEQARQRQGMLGGLDVSDPAALRQAANSTTDPQAKLFLSDRAATLEKTQADVDRLNRLGTGGAGGGGTGPERMAQHVAKVQTALASGEPVSEQDKNLAVAYTGILSKNQFFKQEDGSIVGVDKNDFGKIGDLIQAGAVEIPVGIPSPTAPSAQVTPSFAPPSRPAPASQPARSGARVVETPASLEAKKKAQQGIQSQIDTIDADLANIFEARKIVSPTSAGFGAILGIVPTTDARRLQTLITGIDAAKVFSELTKLREASATGASGLGQVTEREISLLQNRLRALDPYGDPAKLKDDLDYIANEWKKIQDRLKESQGSSETPSGNADQANEALINKWMSANPGKSREQIINGLKKKGLIK
jgi:hypothetical protein